MKSKKIEIETIYGIRTNINPEDFMIENYDKNKIYHILHGSCIYDKGTLIGYSDIILTEEQLNEIVVGLKLKINSIKDDTIYFQHNNENEKYLESLKIKGLLTLYTYDGDDDLDIEDTYPEDWKYFYYLTDMKKTKIKAK